MSLIAEFNTFLEYSSTRKKVTIGLTLYRPLRNKARKQLELGTYCRTNTKPWKSVNKSAIKHVEMKAVTHYICFLIVNTILKTQPSGEPKFLAGQLYHVLCI